MVLNSYGKSFMNILNEKQNISTDFRIIELTLNNEINLPFRLRICPEQLSIEKFDYCPKNFYHLEEVNDDENDHNKDSVLIPVAHYTKVKYILNSLKYFISKFIFRKILYKSIFKNSFHFFLM